MAVATAFIQQQDYYGQAGWNMEIFRSENALPVETLHAPKQVATAVNSLWKGRRLMTPVGGGVQIKPAQAINSLNMLSDEQGDVMTARQQVEIGDLSVDQWWWD